jgi:hypothetical protein
MSLIEPLYRRLLMVMLMMMEGWRRARAVRPEYTNLDSTEVCLSWGDDGLNDICVLRTDFAVEEVFQKLRGRLLLWEKTRPEPLSYGINCVIST